MTLQLMRTRARARVLSVPPLLHCFPLFSFSFYFFFPGKLRNELVRWSKCVRQISPPFRVFIPRFSFTLLPEPSYHQGESRTTRLTNTVEGIATLLHTVTSYLRRGTCRLSIFTERTLTDKGNPNELRVLRLKRRELALDSLRWFNVFISSI